MGLSEKKIIQILLVLVSGYFLQYFSHIYLANIISAIDYGDFAVATSMASLFTMLVELGASRVIPKYIPHYQQNGDISYISGLLRGYFIIATLLSITIAIVGSVLGYLDFSIAHKAGTKELHPFIFILWFLPFMASSKIISALLKCFNLDIISELPSRLLLYLLLFLSLCILKSLGSTEMELFSIILFGICNLITLVAYLFLFYYVVPSNYIKVVPQYEWCKWLNTSLPIMFALLIFMNMKQVDIFMIELFAKDEASVGYFSAASQTAQSILVVYTGLTLIYSPVISQAILSDKKNVRKILNKISLFMACFCLPFLLALIFFGKILLGFFGVNYVSVYPTMLLLTLGLTIYTVTASHMIFLQYSGRQNQVLIGQIAALFISIVLNAILIPRFGVFGSALASSCSLILLSIFMFCTSLLSIID